MQLLIATHNGHKTRELREMFGPGFVTSDLTEHPGLPATIETGATFEENATLKAVEASNQFTGMVLADDSGLEVDALSGAPGVRSARYAGENADDDLNRRKLLEELQRVIATTRTARFRCVITLAQQGKVLGVFHGSVEGTITAERRGSAGFGYDPLFIPNGFTQTFAELPAQTKNEISHRAVALKKAVAFLTGDSVVPA